MKKWRNTKLATICARVTSGGTPNTRRPDYYDGSIPWLKTQEVNFNRIYRTETHITDAGLENSSAKWIPENSVIIAMYGATAGRIAINKIPLTTNQACCNLVIDSEKADYRFVYYNLLSRFSSIANLAVGGAQQNLNAGMLKDLDIKLPDLPTQTAIAEILSSLDDKIELNHKINRELEALAQALFKRWFVDFEFPDENRQPYRSAGGEMVESELGPIPKKWKVVQLQDLLEIRYGKDHKALESGSIPVYGSGGIMRYASKALFNKPSILIPRKGSLNNIFLLNEPFWSVDTMFYTEIKDEHYTKYLYYHIKRIDFISMNVGSAVPSMTTKVLNDLPVISPAHSLVLQFDKTLDPIHRLIDIHQKESEQLSDLRNLLLPRLLSGEILPR